MHIAKVYWEAQELYLDYRMTQDWKTSRIMESLRIKEPKYINRVRACLNVPIGYAVTNAEKCNVFYKADTTSL